VGFYIEVPDIKGKAEQIQKIYNAKVIDEIDAHDAIQSGKNAVIVVVRNPNFDAAAFCYSRDEFRRFTYAGDTRPKTWLLVEDRPLIERVSGFEAARKAEEAEKNAV
jgi:hypothetical protein